MRNHERIMKVYVLSQCWSQIPYYKKHVPQIQNQQFCDASRQQIPGAKDKVWYFIARLIRVGLTAATVTSFGFDQRGQSEWITNKENFVDLFKSSN